MMTRLIVELFVVLFPKIRVFVAHPSLYTLIAYSRIVYINRALCFCALLMCVCVCMDIQQLLQSRRPSTALN